MSDFTYHTTNTSAEDAAKILSKIQDAIGFIPNIFAVMAESDQAIQGLFALNSAFSTSSFSAEEQQVILLVTSAVNECEYCVAGHSAFAEKLAIPNSTIVAMRNNQAAENKHYNVLATTVRQLIQHRGRVPSEVISRFLTAGFTEAQLLELVMGICVKTFTNYVGNALGIKLDNAFKPYAWQRPSDSAQRVA